MFNKLLAEQHLNKLLSEYKIKVSKWRTTSSGRANWKKRTIQIPKPTNADRFGVCMHEIKHIIDGNKGKRFEQEFYADKYGTEQMQLLGCTESEITEWIRRMKWHCLSRIAMAHNRGLEFGKINSEIREFFKDVSFNDWINKKVFVRYSKTETKGYVINLSQKISKQEVEMLLNRKGMMLEKSETDDSTYGEWRVRSNGVVYGNTFSNLTAIVSYYGLTL